jgi:hypothetical protein
VTISKTTKPMAEPNHRSHLVETGLWTAKALALYGWADEIRLAARNLKPDEGGFADLRATVKSLLTRWAGASGKFIGVFVMGAEHGVPTVTILSRTYTGEEWIWKLAAEPLDLQVLSVVDVSAIEPIELAKELLHEPLSGIGCGQDVQLQTNDPFLERHGGKWVVDVGRPWWDENGARLKGVQEARERAWKLEQEG